MADDTPAVLLDTRLALRPGEAAEALGICPRTLRKIAPEIPRVWLTRKIVVYPVDSLRDWLRDRADTADADSRLVETLLKEV